MSKPIFIELSQQFQVERRVDAPWEYETDTVYEPVWVNTGNIESMSWSGVTRVKMISGDIIHCQGTLAEIMAKISGQVKS